jgi:protein-tyrosine phosphatase
MPDVLFVCTANLCRSPLAERLLRRQLDRALGSTHAPLVIASAGVRARGGSPMAEDAARTLRRRGGEDRDFSSRPLTRQTLGDPALVLTAERWHRRAVVEMQPRLLRRSFTLLEFARLLPTAGASELFSGPLRQRLTALAAAAAARRGSGVATEPRLDDLADPVGGGPEDFEVCASRIEGALAALIGALAEPPAATADDRLTGAPQLGRLG